MNKRQSITKQLMIRIISMILVLMLAVIGTATFLVYNTVTEMAKSEMTNEAQANTNVLNQMLSEALYTLKPMQDAIEKVDYENEAALLEYLMTTPTVNENLTAGIYMGDDMGHFLDATLWDPGDDYVVKECDWYKEGVSHGNTWAFGAPYQDAQTGRMVVSISVKGNVAGWGTTVICTDMYLDKVSDFISGLSIMDSGYSFIISPNDDMIISHKEQQYNGQIIADAASTEPIVAYIQTLSEINSDEVYSVSANGENYMVVIKPVENTNWYVVSCVEEAIILNRLFVLIGQIAAVAVVLTAVILVVISRAISSRTKPIGKLTEAIEGITSGDFTLEIVPVGNDEITTMSEKLKEFIQSMRGTIQELSDISVELGSQANNSASVSKVLSSSAGVQSESMGQMNSTVDDLAHSIESIAENATTLAETVSVVMDNSTEAERNVEETVTAAERGKEEIERVASNMDQINESVESLSKIVSEVGESTKEIYNITDLIGGIAEQTNLLALNASIEAARAGESGRGFAVVADEIGKLASMSADAVKQIAGLIEKINHQVEETIAHTGESVENIKESKVLVDASYTAFMEIYEKVAMTDQNIKNMVHKIGEVEDVASSMAAITEEQSASTEEILATSENLYEHSQNIADNSNEVETMADSLKDTAEVIRGHMEQFTV